MTVSVGPQQKKPMKQLSLKLKLRLICQKSSCETATDERRRRKIGGKWKSGVRGSGDGQQVLAEGKILIKC